jgi:hypothetical protein
MFASACTRLAGAEIRRMSPLRPSRCSAQARSVRCSFRGRGKRARFGIVSIIVAKTMPNPVLRSSQRVISRATCFRVTQNRIRLRRNRCTSDPPAATLAPMPKPSTLAAGPNVAGRSGQDPTGAAEGISSPEWAGTETRAVAALEIS